jgi:hypothetical protein
MNGQNPETALVEPISMPYQDRSAGLIAFGILTILLGCMAGLLILLMLAGQAATARISHGSAPFSAILPAVLLYGVLAVALVWLGIGSITARRWARALLLIFSWSWLFIGLVALLFTAFIMPKILANLSASGAPGQPALSSTAIGMAMFFASLIVGVIFIILPAVWIFFYNSRHVKATCETRDSLTRWTDACPLPVLALCLWLLFSVAMMLVMPIAGHAVMPFFGMFLTGLPGTMFYLAIAALWSYAAWLLYKLDQRGWWLILIAMVVFMASALLTYARHDIIEMYQLMGYPEAQIEQIQKSGLLTGNRMNWLMSFSVLPFLGYLFFLKKYFRGKS